MRTWPLLVLLLSAAPLAALVVGPEMPEIAVVRTMEELEKQPAVKVGDKGEVRLGLEAVKSPHGTCVLIYALVKGEFAGGPGTWTHAMQPLGPVVVEIVEKKPPGDVLKEAARKVRTGAMAAHCAYVAVLPLPRAGAYRVRVYGPDQQVLAGADLEATKQAADPWWSWAPSDNQELQARPVIEPGDDPPGKPVTTQWSPVVPVWPKYDSFPEAKQLPTFIPEQPHDGLKLSYKAGTLTLVSAEAVSDRTSNFLVRWYVNGKPVSHEAAALNAVEEMKQLLPEPPVTIRWQLAQPLADLGAKAGDRIGCEVLYSEDGWQLAPGTEQALNALAEQLRKIEAKRCLPVRRSNKVEWVAEK